MSPLGHLARLFSLQAKRLAVELARSLDVVDGEAAECLGVAEHADSSRAPNPRRKLVDVAKTTCFAVNHRRRPPMSFRTQWRLQL
jgi:hypothetical protein